jgi:hypothetical protein
LAVGTLGPQLFQAAVNGFNHQNHSGTTTVWRIVNGFVFAGSVITEVMDDNLGQAFALGPAQNAMMN